MTGTAEQAFYDGDHATVGPFTDLTVPANPFTITPTQPTSPPRAPARTPLPSQRSSRGLLIAVGAGAALLLLTAAVGITWARRRTS